MRLVKLGLAFIVMLTAAAVTRAQPVPGGDDPGSGQGTPSAPSAPSAGGVITSVTAEQLAQLFVDAGFQARVQQTGDSKMVLADFWPGRNVLGGSTLNICQNGQCGMLSLQVVIPRARVKPEWANKWNSSKAFVRAYMENNGTLTFRWDVPVAFGVTPNYIVQTIHLFKDVVDDSSKFKG